MANGRSKGSIDGTGNGGGEVVRKGGKHHCCDAGWSYGAKSSQGDPGHLFAAVQP